MLSRCQSTFVTEQPSFATGNLVHDQRTLVAGQLALATVSYGYTQPAVVIEQPAIAIP